MEEEDEYEDGQVDVEEEFEDGTQEVDVPNSQPNADDLTNDWTRTQKVYFSDSQPNSNDLVDDELRLKRLILMNIWLMMIVKMLILLRIWLRMIVKGLMLLIQQPEIPATGLTDIDEILILEIEKVEIKWQALQNMLAKN